ncbi:MAG: sugar ABC transporter substrate-binding protein [Geobacteraceae bacterium GWC2_58_44]|nr:MAG: sugar ABC transporter substrate-binding protein [Geobacteraceae bacterium GWC2_58_44]HBG07902.1 sugar ABC transporter substrate-binding protein [Geobacter sp.]
MKRLLMALMIGLLLSFPLAAQAADYVIGEGDSLDVSVWGVKELNFSVKVRPDGKITVPGLGEVVASGSTPSALQSSLAERLKELVKNPIVTVSVREITNSKVYIFGGGVKSTVYELSRRTSLLQLLCIVSELKGADLDKAYLLRSGKKVKSNLHRLFIGGEVEEDLLLESGDALFLPLLLDKSVYVLGAVNTPRAIEFREGMKVMEAILESGGFTKFADQNDVVVRRKDGKEALSLEVKAKRLFKEGDLSQNIELKAGDYVMVKEGFF